MFKERLKELRELKGLTQTQLSIKLDIGRASVSNYELGSRTPDIEVLVRIADFFNVTTDYLTGRSNFKHSEEEGFFTDAEKKFISNINVSFDTKNIEDGLVNDIDMFKATLLKLFDSDAPNLQLEISFVKAINHIYSIYRSFKRSLEELNEDIKNNKFINNEIKTINDIYELLNTDLSKKAFLKLDFSSELYRIIEELYNIKNELEQELNQTLLSTLHKALTESSFENKNLTALLESFNKYYIGDSAD